MVALETASEEAVCLRSLILEVLYGKKMVLVILIHCDSTTIIAKVQKCY